MGARKNGGRKGNGGTSRGKVTGKGGSGSKASARREGLAQALSAGGGSGGGSRRPESAAPPKINAAKKLSAQNLQRKRDELRRMQVRKHRAQAASLEELMGHASKTAQAFQAKDEGTSTNSSGGVEVEINDASRRAYMKELRKVVDRADVILEVLDARDPMGCRTVDMEEMIGNRGGKKVVLVLNKIDLVPPHVLQPWLSYLRTFYPTVAFKASTQQQGSHLSANFGRADRASSDTVSASKAVGTDALMQLLKNYCRNAHIKTAITVGVIGYPNVGKSSVINSLKRSKAASVSSVAGHTKVMQEVHIDSKIKLLDCPGIVFDHSDSNALLLRNCVNTETMADPVGAVQVILSRCEPAQLLQLYGLPTSALTPTMTDNGSFTDVVEFLVLVARTKGKLGKGGIPDRHAAARIVLQDWNRGKIPFFTPPPDQKHTILDSQIVSTFSDAFNVDEVLNPSSIFLSEQEQQQMQSSDTPAVPSLPSSVVPSTLSAGASGVAVASLSMQMSGNGIHESASLMAARAMDSDSDSDSDMEDDDGDDAFGHPLENADNGQASMFTVANVNLQQLTKKMAQDQSDPQAALAARRRAKQWRKLKRRTARQQIGQAAESEVCEQLESMMDIGMADALGEIDDSL